MLVGVTEGMLPFRLDDEPGDEHTNDNIAVRLQEERRLMYVGITRAQRSLAVSWTKRRKKGRETVAALPSRFIAEMRLNENTVREDPREKLKALRAEFAQRAADAAGRQHPHAGQPNWWPSCSASPAIPFTCISAITRRNWPNNNDEPARGRHEHETHRNERTMDRLYYPAQA